MKKQSLPNKHDTSINAGPMLSHRLRRRTNISRTLGQCVVFYWDRRHPDAGLMLDNRLGCCPNIKTIYRRW